jgi:hypothetical protein
LDHASKDPRSCRSKDTSNLSPTTPAGQAATRAAYIARVVSEAPPLTDAQLDHLAVLLRPRAAAANAAPLISVDQYRHWEIVRYLDEETPGRNGYFTAEDAA